MRNPHGLNLAAKKYQTDNFFFLTTIISNLVLDNNNYAAPTNRFGLVAKGMGIVVPGRVGDIIEKNIVVNHDKYGIVASPMLDAKLYFSQHVQVKNNLVLDIDQTKL